MQVFGLPSQFASATKTATHWPQKNCCELAANRARTEGLACRAAQGTRRCRRYKCPWRPDINPAQDLFKKAYDPCAAKEPGGC